MTTQAPINVPGALTALAARDPDCYVFACAGLIGATPELLIGRQGRQARGRHQPGDCTPGLVRAAMSVGLPFPTVAGARFALEPDRPGLSRMPGRHTRRPARRRAHAVGVNFEPVIKFFGTGLSVARSLNSCFAVAWSQSTTEPTL